MGRRADHTREQLSRLALDAAVSIVNKEGLRGLTARGIAEQIGYVAGTLYQLFADLDDLIITMNCETLEFLYSRVEPIALDGPPEESLIRLADVYVELLALEPRRWNAVFEYSMPVDRPVPDRYVQAVGSLLGLVKNVMAPLFKRGEEDQMIHEVRVLWASLYGIATLATSGKSSVEPDPSEMIRSLARNYITGLRARRRAETAKRRRVRKG